MLSFLQLVSHLKIVFVENEEARVEEFLRSGVVLRQDEKGEFHVGHFDINFTIMSLIEKLDFTLYKEGSEYILKVY